MEILKRTSLLACGTSLILVVSKEGVLRLLHTTEDYKIKMELKTENPVSQVCFRSSKVDKCFLLDYCGLVWKFSSSDTRLVPLHHVLPVPMKYMSFSCYQSGYFIGMDSNLWEFIYAEEIFQKVNLIHSNPVKFVSCGFNFTFIICNDYSVWSHGDNSNGQLALGDFIERNEFSKVDTLGEDFIFIACGKDHSLFLTKNQKVYVCGGNENGQLGIENIEKSEKLIVNENLFLISMISVQNFKSFCVDEQGSLFGFGEFFGFTPTKIYVPIVKFISTGLCLQTCIQDIDGFLWVLKDNSFIKSTHKFLCGIKNLLNLSISQQVERNRLSYVSFLFHYSITELLF